MTSALCIKISHDKTIAKIEILTLSDFYSLPKIIAAFYQKFAIGTWKNFAHCKTHFPGQLRQDKAI